MIPPHFTSLVYYLLLVGFVGIIISLLTRNYAFAVIGFLLVAISYVIRLTWVINNNYGYNSRFLDEEIALVILIISYVMAAITAALSGRKAMVFGSIAAILESVNIVVGLLSGGSFSLSKIISIMLVIAFFLTGIVKSGKRTSTKIGITTKEYPDDAFFNTSENPANKCGICPGCGKLLEMDAAFCGYCGMKIKIDTSPKKLKHSGKPMEEVELTDGKPDIRQPVDDSFSDKHSKGITKKSSRIKYNF